MEASVDSERVRVTAEAIGKALGDNFNQGPVGRERVLENLNALAWMAGATIAGTGTGREAAHKFFMEALEKTIEHFDERAPIPGEGTN